MAIAAKFVADFSSWKASVQDAQADLAKLKATSDQASASLGRMTDAQAGRFVATTAEMKKAGFATQEWAKELRQVDSILNVAGISVGKHASALGELGAMAGKGATSLGLLGTAAGIAGAAFAGWQFGRWIAGLTGLDQKVADVAAKLFNLGDARAAGAGAAEATIAAAKQHAVELGLEASAVQTLSDAIRINDEWMKRHNLTTGYSRTAAEDSRLAIHDWGVEIGNVYRRGDIKNLNADLESQNLKLNQLTVKYGVTAEALEWYIREQKKASDAQQARAKEWSDAHAEMKKAIDITAATDKAMWEQSLVLQKKQQEELERTRQAHLALAATINEGVIAEMNARQQLAAIRSPGAAPGSLEGLTAQYESDLAGLRGSARPGYSTAAREDILYLQYQKAFLEAAQAADQMGAAVAEAGQKTEAAGRQTERAAAQAQQAAGSYQQMGAAVQYAAGSFQNMWTQVGHAKGHESALRTFSDMAAAYGRAGVFVVPNQSVANMPHRATGGPVAGGWPYWVGERGPEVFIPQTSGAIVPQGTGAVTVTVNIQGSLLSTTEQIAAAMNEALMRSYRQGGNRIPA